MIELLLIIGAVKVTEWIALGSMLGALLLAVVAVAKLPLDRGTLRIGKEQGAMMMRDNFITALQRELERKLNELERADDVIADRDRQIQELRVQLEQCRDQTTA